MAFVFSRTNKRRKTCYVGYYIDGRFVRQKDWPVKSARGQGEGDIEVRIERREAGLLCWDYPFRPVLLTAVYALFAEGSDSEAQAGRG